MDTQTRLSTTLHFTPSLDSQWIWVIVFIGSHPAGPFIVFDTNVGIVMRSVMFIAFIIALLSPSLLERRPQLR